MPCSPDERPLINLQRRRIWFQAGFFALFVLAPPLDILRLDLNLGHIILFGYDWTLGIDGFLQGEESIYQAVANLLLRGFLPLVAAAALFLWCAWRFGHLYCGWLCPHFSVVEVINNLMLRASGKPGLWEPKALPSRQADGSERRQDPRYWLLVVLAVAGISFLWALAFLTYLLPPFEIYHNLINGQLTRNQMLFLSVVTVLLSIEFTFARHLFCRYACSVGHFQSLAWMANNQAMVVSFDARRARQCGNCNNACDNVCPMRLKPRSWKRKIFACTQCGLCLTACQEVMGDSPSLLNWVGGPDAIQVVGPLEQRKETVAWKNM